MATYRAEFTKIAEKDFFNLDSITRKRVAKKIAFFLDQADPVAHANRLQDFEGGDYRWRVGKYRIMFDVDETQKIIKVLHIEHRRSAYRK